MKKMVKQMIMVVMVIATIIACKKDDPPQKVALEISPSEKIVFSGEALSTENKTITVTTSGEWSVAISEEWCSVTKNNDNTFTVSASENPSTTQIRTAIITVKAQAEGMEPVEKTITVEQLKLGAPHIVLSIDELTLAYNQTSATDIVVTTNQSVWDFTLSEGASAWLTVTKGEGKITVTAAANTGAARTATITLTAGEGTSAATATISVAQAAAPAPSISAAQTTLTLAHDQTSATDIVVTTNQSVWDFSLSEGSSSWLTVTKGEGKITVTAAANTGAARTATITLTAGEGVNASTIAVVVTQNSDPSRIETVNIAAGSFLMGSPASEPYFYEDEGPQRTIPMSAFRMSKYEITNAQFAHFLNSNKEHITTEVGGSMIIAKMTIDGEVQTINWNYHDDGSGQNYSLANKYNAATQTWAPDAGYENYPATMVTWWGAKAFAQWVGGKLPSESQWEYACRAGTTTPWYWGTDENEASNYEAWQAPVGSKRPNPWGLYDMGGSVIEWCLDDFTRGAYFRPATLDWVNIIPGATAKAKRGGSTVARYRSAYRTYAEASSSHYDTGFRVVFTN